MQAAGIVSLAYVFGMLSTFVVGYFVVMPHYLTHRSSEAGQGIADIFVFLYMVALSVVWFISVPLYLISLAQDRICTKKT